MVVSCPVRASAVTVPRSFCVTPWPLRYRYRYARALLAGHGVAADAPSQPTNTDPVSGEGKSGVSISTVPTWDAAGHVGGASEPCPNCAGAHAARPLAADGLSVMPAGRVTRASFRVAVAWPVGSSFWGTCKS